MKPTSLSSASLAFSDPANVTVPPAHAIGFPSRATDLDARPGFQQPPPGYGEVPFYWWVGDPLVKERLVWQLDQLAGRGIMGLQINYAHTDAGGIIYGLSMPSDPPLFSAAWWELVTWFKQEADKRGMAISLSDYTLGLGQGWVLDELLKDHPEMMGAVLAAETRDTAGGELRWALPPDTLMVAAYRLDGDTIVPDSGIDLRNHIAENYLCWQAPAAPHRVVAVHVTPVVPSLDPMHPQSGPAYAERFFGIFEKRFPDAGGKALNFFFSDELEFRLRGHLWNRRFAAAFMARKGYDVIPELPALFVDLGPRTPKVRLDYGDVKVALSEEGFFRPVFDWHQQRGMIFGCDHGGRGRDVSEFGDYFRTQRWNQGPGCDQPLLQRDIVKNKVASSIAHLYLRPRVWLEGFHSSGWGTSSGDVTDATLANFAQGQNLLTLHGLYYSTHGGWWEWAPPCNHFRQPYWAHMSAFMTCVERLGYLLSQGHHRCDVALLYPVAPVEAGLGGDDAVATAFATGEALYRDGIDFDFMDFESLERATVTGGRLHVSGEEYRILLFPAMRAVRFSMLRKALEFKRAGGTVLAVGALPEASDRVGGQDPELEAIVGELFGDPRNNLTAAAEVVAGVTARLGTRDVAFAGPVPPALNFMHRRVGPRDIYLLHGAPQGATCTLRATGQVELWDPWTGATRPLPVIHQTAATTTLHLPLTEPEAQIIVFSPGPPLQETATAAPAPAEIAVPGPWTGNLLPTLDNRWGDYRWPAGGGMIGAEARRFRYQEETARHPGWEKPDFDDAAWPRVTHAFGPKFQQLGPLPGDADCATLERTLLAAAASITAGKTEYVCGKEHAWTPYAFSWRWGVEGDPGHQGWHGLKEEAYDDFIRLGKLVDQHKSYVREPEDGGSRYYLWTTVVAPAAMTGKLLLGGMAPGKIWINGQAVAASATSVPLHAGPNPVLLRYDQPGTGFFLITRPEFILPEARPGALAMRWHEAPGILPFDVRPGEAKPAGWYRFKTAPGTRTLTLTAHGHVQAWMNGISCNGNGTDDGKIRFEMPARDAGGETMVALRIEQDRGVYGGAALPEPVTFEGGESAIALGDWSQLEGLASYSGGRQYRTTLNLTAAQATGKLTLDLGEVASSAEVLINGQAAGVRVAPPWRWEVTGLFTAGDNRIEVLVYNTLANHYLTIPTRYRGSPKSGLLGPVRLLCG
jgi:hypothetical protein